MTLDPSLDEDGRRSNLAAFFMVFYEPELPPFQGVRVTPVT